MENRDIKKAMKSNENFLALLKQAAQSDEYRKLKKRTEEGPHPTDEMLYDYVLDTVDDKDARKIRDHISLCGICAKEVLQIRMMEDKAEADLVAWTDGNGGNNKKSLWERIRRFASCLSLTCSDWWAGFSIRPRQFMMYATATCLIIYFFEPCRNFFWPRDLITQSYQTGLTFKLEDSAPRLPWQSTVKSYGFSHSGGNLPSNRAFGAGLWTGAQKLSKENASVPIPEFLSPKWQGDDIKADEWSETPWSPYFSLGRWGFLIQTVCQSGEVFPYEFWEKQDRILSQIQEKFEQMPENIRENVKVIDKVLGEIDAVLKKSDKNPPTKRQRRKIASQLGNLIKYLSPKHIPQG